MSSQVYSDMRAKQKRYEALVHAFHGDIYRYAYWLTRDSTIAEDIVQETFLRAWRSLDSLNDEKSAKSWLITIVRRENARRFERKQLDLVDIDDVHVADDAFHANAESDHEELRILISRLPTDYREPLILQLIFGFTGEEIAQQLDLNKNTVMTRLFRARNQLRDMLGQEDTNLRGRSNG
ncbi:sigma-70 family RNA polymerase sigma factor [Aestuariibacter sp. A3R04]|nr:sigma-70 family RNA polymerase sigma factor [Aestuariibacter sp. A3R04]